MPLGDFSRHLQPIVVRILDRQQTDFNANCRKFVATFLRDVVRAHPEHVGLVVPVASYLMHDSNANVKKVCLGVGTRLTLHILIDLESREP